MQGAQYAAQITATSSSGGAVLFYVTGATGVSLKARQVYFRNAGSSSDVYVNFTSTSGGATITGCLTLETSQDIMITAPDGGYYTGLSYAAAASTSSSVACNILAIR